MEYEIASKIPLAELRDPEQVYASQSGDTFKYIAPLTVEEVNNYANNKTDIFSVKNTCVKNFPLIRFLQRLQHQGRGLWMIMVHLKFHRREIPFL
jgi:hypothetical protein